jgi:hypothetical protein
MVFSGSTCAGTALTFTHELALVRAVTVSTNTQVAWRLPNIKELASIIVINLGNPAIDPAVFPATPGSFFWSASPYVGNSAQVGIVHFGDGGIGNLARYYGSSYVRLVRAGQ